MQRFYGGWENGSSLPQSNTNSPGKLSALPGRIIINGYARCQHFIPHQYAATQCGRYQKPCFFAEHPQAGQHVNPRLHMIVLPLYAGSSQGNVGRFSIRASKRHAAECRLAVLRMCMAQNQYADGQKKNTSRLL